MCVGRFSITPAFQPQHQVLPFTAPTPSQVTPPVAPGQEASAASTAGASGAGTEPAAIALYCAGHGLPATLCLPPDPRLTACDWSGFAIHDTAAPDEALALAIARVGIAETGSLVFETGPAAPMLPNFLALHHIVLVPRLVAYLEDATLPGDYPRAHYWVTGVSGTTDIEGTYVRGAHGPRFLHVIRLGD